MTLSKAFPDIRNKTDLEIWFYSSQHRMDQKSTDFIYDLLKLDKLLGLRMSENLYFSFKLMWRFEIRKTSFNYWRCCPSLRKYIHVKQCGVRGTEIMLKDEFGMSVGCLMQMIVDKNWRNLEVLHIPRNGRNDYKGNYENGRQ
ncbi:hypothetical protein TNCV_2308661 [Trichonephila clavipes]|nr:hypothetical protein TNCV_2308661 [Trichonephila clavipes]